MACTHLPTEMVFLAKVSSFLMYAPISWHNFKNAALESLKLATNLKSRSNHSVDLLLPVFLRLLLNFSKKALFYIILRQMTVFVIRQDSPIFSKRSSKYCLCGMNATWRRNFEMHAMLDCHCYGQHSYVGGLFFKKSGLDLLSRKHSRILTKKVESSLNNTSFSSCKIVLESWPRSWKI